MPQNIEHFPSACFSNCSVTFPSQLSLLRSTGLTRSSTFLSPSGTNPILTQEFLKTFPSWKVVVLLLQSEILMFHSIFHNQINNQPPSEAQPMLNETNIFIHS